jgi:hypothetical protein
LLAINGFNQDKMNIYNIDVADTCIIDYIIYIYSCDIVPSIIINDTKYISFNKEKINKNLNALNLKERGLEQRINNLIASGFFERNVKFVDKKKRSFIKPTNLCLFIKDFSYNIYEEFVKHECADYNKEDVEKRTIKVKHLYKECKHVKFTDEELSKLKQEFPFDYETQIMNCENYCESKGKNYSNYLQTIRNWNKGKKNMKNTNIDVGGLEF